MLQKGRVGYTAQDDVGRRTSERIAAESRAVVAGAEGLCHLIRHDKSTDGHAAREALRQRYDVRLNAVVFIGKELAAAADARLNFIEDEQRVMLVAEGPHLF